jgi:hypothetical protein
MKPRDVLRTVTAKVSKESLVGEAIVEAVDDILLGDVGSSGTSVEETVSVGSQEVVMFQLALR